MSTLVADVGDVVRFYTSEPFTLDGVATNPDLVTLTILKPDGTTVLHYDWPDAVAGHEGLLDHDIAEPGVFSVEVAVDQGGPWHYRWASSGTAQAAEEGRVFVRRPTVALGL